MKKLLIIFLTIILTLSFSACGEKNITDNTDKNGKENNDNSSFTEIVVADNKNCSIIITGIDSDNSSGFTVQVELKNKSNDKSYMVSIEDSFINGIDCLTDFALQIDAGKKYNADIILLSNQLKDNGVGDFTDIELTFFVFDLGNWDAGTVVLETVHIYPYGEDKASKYVRETQPSDNVIVDNQYVKVIVIGYDPENENGYAVDLFLLNKTASVAMFSVADASVNGHNINPYYTAYVSANGCAFSSIVWPDNILKEKGITDIEEIQLLLAANTYENWQGDYYFKETFTLNP